MFASASVGCDNSTAPTAKPATADLPRVTDRSGASSMGSSKPAISSADVAKAAQCGALVKAINNNVARMEKIERSPRTDAGPTAPLLAMAAAMSKAEKEVGEIVFTIPKLKALSKQYSDMASDVSKGAHNFITAIEQIDAKAMGKAQRTLETAVKREDPIVEEVNTFCGTG